MNIKRATVAFFCVISSAALIGPARAQDRENLGTTGEFLDGVAAIVENGVVLKSELASRTDILMASLRQQQEAQPAEKRRTLPPRGVVEQQVLDQLVVREIQLQRAKKIGITVSDDMLNQALSRVADNLGYTLEELPAVLASENIAHILIGVPANALPQDLEAARTKIEEIYTRLENGEDFARLAIATSHAQTALDGGSLGWRKGSQLPTLFADTVVRMKPGEYSKPLQSGSGFQIVMLNDMRGASRTVVDQVHVRHILLRPNEILDEPAVRQKLLGIRAQLQRGDDFATIAKSVSEDKVSAADGGDMGWVQPTDFIPEFEQMLATMPLNEVSEPLRTRYGWHLVEVLGRRSQDTTDEVKREGCSREVRANKAEEERELWIRRLRDQAFVCNYVTGGVQDCASAGVTTTVASSGKVSSKISERKKKNKTL